MTSLPSPTLICFGEILWDCLPSALFLGGAPANVAYHLQRHGCTAHLATAVGNDFLGQEATRRVRGWGAPTDLIAVVDDAPTGVVQVNASVPTAPVYTIVENSAWDRIPYTPQLGSAAFDAAAIVFGTLSLRSGSNRETLDRVLSGYGGLRVLDINLRPPFDKPDAIEFAASRADLLKLNDQEVLVGSGSSTLPDIDALPAHAARWARRYNLSAVCVTCGARGAGLLMEGEWSWVDGREVIVKDTVGAGDAFLAALIASLLGGAPAKAALARACRTGELVAAHDGATPAYDASSIE
jgi:fructokinase